MGLQFIDNVKGNDRGFIQEFIEREVDRDTDVYTATVSTNAGDYAYVRRGWHTTEEDPEDHITADVYLGGSILGAAHINRLGQVTMFSAGENPVRLSVGR